MKFFRTKLLPAASAACLVIAAACLPLVAIAGPSSALAEEPHDENALYDPEVMTIEDDPGAPAKQGYIAYQKTDGTLKVVLCAVTDANKDALADAALAKASTGLPVKFVNESFVDADKYSNTCDSFDKYHCWLASTSNILTLTGWAERYINPLTGARFGGEDDTFSFLSSSFSDTTCLPDLAYSYFFDGLFGGTRHSKDTRLL